MGAVGTMILERDDGLNMAEDIIGRSFIDRTVFRLALTHSIVGPSNNEAPRDLGRPDLQRLDCQTGLRELPWGEQGAR